MFFLYIFLNFTNNKNWEDILTQKELLYYEDAICHLDNIIKLIDDFLNNLDEKNLVDFMKEKKECNINLRKKLNDLLLEVSNG